MKLPWDKKHICWGITAFCVIAASIILYMILHKWSEVASVIALVFKSLKPITYGLILAYILNPLMNMIERTMALPAMNALLKKRKDKARSLARAFSIILTWATAFLFILAIVDLVVPELYKSIESLVLSLPSYADTAFTLANDLLNQNPEILDFLKESINGFTTDITEIVKRIQSIMPNLNSFITGISSGLFGGIKVIFNLFVGVIVSIYILKDKERFAAQSKKVLYSTMSAKNANTVIAISRLTHSKFGNFITGKIFDSIIIGILCFIILNIFNIPYSALVSVVIGVTNVIPFFGPFLGAIPSSILILFANPIKCIPFIIIIVALQQFDGNILGPKILGNSIGISSFWVMFSILIGSGLFGVWGMVCAVPIFAVIYVLISDGCRSSLIKKGFNYSSKDFESIDHIDENSGKPVRLERD
ncbi:MAG: AI-2E family transporter [Clostridia bacterium]|nr:AI-2E family transporter [Clostridia bacterium]